MMNKMIQKLIMGYVGFVFGTIFGIGYVTGFDQVISTILDDNELRTLVLSALAILFIIGVVIVSTSSKNRT